MHKLLEQIRDSKELLDLEEQGFRRGDEKGKTMDVLFNEIKESLYLQEGQLIGAIARMDYGKRGNDDVKRKIADLRNVAGCLFLKLAEEESKRE